MTTRKIKIVSTTGVSGEIMTNVQTLGELKPLLLERDINLTGIKILVGATKNELSVDEAVLPAEDCKIYLVPSKTKSGSIEEDLEELIDTVDAVNFKLNKVLNILEQRGIESDVPKRVISEEDARDIEEARELAVNWI